MLNKREIDAIMPGAIVVHRKTDAIGRCENSSKGISVCYTLNGIRGQTIGDYPNFVAKSWRLAGEKEVRQYYNSF